MKQLLFTLDSIVLAPLPAHSAPASDGKVFSFVCLFGLVDLYSVLLVVMHALFRVPSAVCLLLCATTFLTVPTTHLSHQHLPSTYAPT